MTEKINLDDVRIEPSWKKVLANEFSEPYFLMLRQYLKTAKTQGEIIYPKGADIFRAFSLTPFDEVKVVILGQDPYHNPNQADGLSFSVPIGTRMPPSLLNIFKEIETDLGKPMPPHGNLDRWATQGVLMLNAILTVRAGAAASHQKIGWQSLTDAAIQALSDQRNNIVFLLWGAFAQKKSILIDHQKHLVLMAAHPSPLANGAFFGSKHFSKTNDYLQQNDLKLIDW